MKTIYKYPIEIHARQLVQMRAHAKVIHAGLDPAGNPCLWAEVDTDARLVNYEVYIVGTGLAMPEATVRHLGSILQGEFMWHVYIRCA